MLIILYLFAVGRKNLTAIFYFLQQRGKKNVCKLLDGILVLLIKQIPRLVLSDIAVLHRVHNCSVDEANCIISGL